MYYHEVRDIMKTISKTLDDDRKELFTIISFALAGKNPFKN